MEALSDLNTFAKILTDKGYNGYFHTQGAYAGKLKDSISEYLESCRKGTEGAAKPVLLVTGYLQWAGEDKPRVECSMWVKCVSGKFFLSKMEVARKDQYGQLLKQSQLINLSVITAPKAREAIALVSDEPKRKIAYQKKVPGCNNGK
ncbi:MULTISPECIES: hypothetical protein [Bacteroidota]|uniref:hypothetical protein n=1 Tax=Bacteroidota TaxID=976 RepID=UPI001CBECC86|nr:MULTISPECIES: hypothetical protein [Bacteroidota]MBZ4190801.1 hypothetical protein [Niabella beijingensis]UMQ40808.1 hypothetical protein MKS83_15565 [Chryseobacterium sp. Y16C]